MTSGHPLTHLGRALALVAGLCLANAAQAGAPPNITPNETSLLPPYCKDTQTWRGSTPEGMVRGKAIYGESFWHFHHYCFAQLWMLRAERYQLGSWDRKSNLTGALDDLDYVIERMPEDHFLLPEILTRKGKVLRMLERRREAIDVLNGVIERSPRYWRAFLELANCYEASNQRPDTIATLRRGLEQNPNAKALSTFLADLEKEGNGKLASAPKSSMPEETTRRVGKDASQR